MVAETTLAIAVALLATVFYALSSNLVRAGMGNSRTVGALFVSLTVNLVVLWTASLLLFDVSVDLWQWRYFIAAGALAPVVARFFNYSGIDKLGVNVSTPLTFMYPFVSIVIAVPLLGERLPPAGLLGGAFVVFGGVVLALPDEETAIHIDDRKFLLLPLAAALLYGTSHVLRKVGIDLVTSPVIAAAVTATTSWVLLAGYLGVTRSFDLVRVNRREALLFGAAGLVTSVAIPLLYLAFSLGSVVLVTPITNVSPLFVLVFSYVLYRDGEPFTRRVVGGTGLIVLGLVLLARFSATG
jgi:drug/metabolite transporter (DMT)-like permease